MGSGPANLVATSQPVCAGGLPATLGPIALLEPVNPAPGNPPAGQLQPSATPKTVTAVLGGVNANFSVPTNTTTMLTITQEDARVTYAGNMFVGIPLSSSSAPITLIATIQDISAVTSDLATDIY